MNKNIIETYLEEEMHSAFLEYSEEFIENRAIPNVHDGFKPVQRRILYTFYDLGITHEKQFKKSARVVGDALGKWHPHGDSSVYEAMIRLGQPWNQRYPLVLIHGNAGSVDGDSAAAMRYTEVKSSEIASEFFEGLHKNVVDWTLNFDDTLYEPSVLPTIFPNYLVNGGMGIASGVSCDIPPHNLTEVINCITHYIDNPASDLSEYMKILKGPDFPTGGIIEGKDFKEIYATGFGKVKVRAKHKLEPQKNGRTNIVIVETPYQTKNSNILEKIADLIKNNGIEGVYDLRDESSLEEGIRIVVECKKDVDPNYVLKILFSKTDLEKTQSIQMRAIVDGNLKTLSLIGYIETYLDFQKKILKKKLTFDLEKAQSDLHVQEGFITCLEHIQEVVSIIYKSKETKVAKQLLIESFKLSDVQAQAILDLKLSRITSLGLKETQDKVKSLKQEIRKIEKMLSSEKSIMLNIKESLERINTLYGDKRRSKIVKNLETIDAEKPKVEISLLIKDRMIKTYQTKNFKNDGGILLETDNDSIIILFNRNGSFYKYHTTDIPNKIPFDVIGAFSLKFSESNKTFTFFTKKGYMKRTEILEFDIKRETSSAIKLDNDDELLFISMNTNDLLLVQGSGYDFGRFLPDNIPVYGRVSRGVKSIKLKDGDYIEGVYLEKEIESIQITTDKETINIPGSKLKTFEESKTHHFVKIVPKKVKNITNVKVVGKNL